MDNFEFDFYKSNMNGKFIINIIPILFVSYLIAFYITHSDSFVVLVWGGVLTLGCLHLKYVCDYTDAVNFFNKYFIYGEHYSYRDCYSDSDYDSEYSGELEPNCDSDNDNDNDNDSGYDSEVNEHKSQARHRRAKRSVSPQRRR